MEVWVLVREGKRKTHHALRLKEEAEFLGVNLTHVCAEDFEIIEPSDEASKIWFNGEYVKIPDVLITRVTGMSYFSLALVRLLEGMGCKVMNSAASIESAEDKLRTIQILTTKNLPIPTSILAKYPVDIDYVSERLGFPLIMKTVFGAKGEGVLMFDNYNQLKDVTHILQKTTEGKVNLIFQHFVANSFGRDLRVFVIGGRAVGAVVRKGQEGQFKANVAAGGSAEKFELSDELAALAVEASGALGLSIAGVDFLFDEGKLLIGEINSSPSFDGFEAAAGVNVSHLVLEYAIKEGTRTV